MTKPHVALTVVRPDEVAECWEGIFDVPGLYNALWDCTAAYTGPTPEESEEPIVGLNSVADFWDRFSPEHQEALNVAAAADDGFDYEAYHNDPSF